MTTRIAPSLLTPISNWKKPIFFIAIASTVTAATAAIFLSSTFAAIGYALLGLITFVLFKEDGLTQRNVKQLMNQTDETTRRVNTLDHELQGASQVIAQNTTLRREIDQQISRFQQAQATLEAQQRTLTTEVNNLTQENQRLTQANVNLTEQTRNLTEEQQRNLATIERLTQDNQRLTQVNDRLSEENRHINEEQRTRVTTLANTTVELQRMSEMKGILEANNARLQAQVTELVETKGDNSQLKTQVRELNQELEEANEDIEKVHQELAERDQLIKDLNSKIGDLNSTIVNLHNEITLLRRPEGAKDNAGTPGGADRNIASNKASAPPTPSINPPQDSHLKSVAIGLNMIRTSSLNGLYSTPSFDKTKKINES